MGLAIVSLIVLAVIGALAGFVLARIFGAAAASNENQPVEGSEEDGNSQGGLGEETRRSVWFFLGMGAAGSAILIDVAAVVSAFFNDQQYVNNAVPVAFLAFMLAIIGYLLGARMVAVGAAVFTVIALAVAAAIVQWL